MPATEHQSGSPHANDVTMINTKMHGESDVVSTKRGASSRYSNFYTFQETRLLCLKDPKFPDHFPSFSVGTRGSKAGEQPVWLSTS
jgi:hypothetical protein